MLQCVEAKIGQPGSVGMSKDPKDATLFVKLVEVSFSQVIVPELQVWGKHWHHTAVAWNFRFKIADLRFRLWL
jgi:hypothetical protein